MVKSIKEITEESLKTLNSSDRYGRVYNKKTEYMPLPSEIIEKFNLPIEFAKIGSSILTKTSDNVESEAFSTYVLEARLHNDEVIEGYSGVVGLLVNNSQNKISVFSGVNAAACTNLNIFGAEFVKEINLIGSVKTLGAIVEEAKNGLFSRLESFKQVKERLEAKTYNTQQFVDRKGDLVNSMSLELFDYIKWMESVFRDKNSIYYDMPNSDWKLLQGLTDKIKNEGPNKRLQSTLALEKYFN